MIGAAHPFLKSLRWGRFAGGLSLAGGERWDVGEGVVWLWRVRGFGVWFEHVGGVGREGFWRMEDGAWSWVRWVWRNMMSDMTSKEG